MSLVAIYALVWSVYAVLIFGAFRWIAPPRSARTSFARALLWSAALITLGDLAAIPWEPGRVCAIATGLFLLVTGVIFGAWAIRLLGSRA